MGYSYNNENEFLKWYKANYGTEFTKGSTFKRPEGMDDNTWAAASELYRGYLDSLNKDSEIDSINKKYNESTNSILQRYSSAQNTLDENKRLAQQNASITYDKLKKYLPSQIKAQGLSGLGASESAMLEADSYYMNSMGDIASNYSKDVTDLSNSKNEAIANLEKYRNDDLSKIEDKYAGYLRDSSDKAFEAYRTGVETDFTNAYNAALTDINSRTDVDEATMEQYINATYSGKVRDPDLQRLISTGKSVVAKNVKIAEEKAAEEKEINFANAYNAALTDINSRSDVDEATMEQYINATYSGKVRDPDLQLLISAGKSRVANNKKIAEEKLEGEKALALENTVIPTLIEFETNGEWDEALAYLEKNKDYFTNSSEYEAKWSYLTDKIAKRTEEAEIISGKRSFSPPGDKALYLIDTSNSYSSKELVNFKEFKKALKDKGLTTDSYIPNGTTLKFTVVTSPMGSGRIEVPRCVSYFNGKWYNSKVIASSEHVQIRNSLQSYSSYKNVYNYLK